MRRAIALILTLSSAAVLAACVTSYWTTMTMYRSTDRYCLRLRSGGGRVALLYDGGPEVLSPRNGKRDLLVLRYSASTAAGWQFIELSAPGWLLALALSVYPTISVLRGPLRRRRRRRRGECLNCGYNLTGNVTGICSECGVPCDA